MLGREFHIRFTLSDLGKALCFSPVLIVLIYLLICLPWSSANAPAWVQALGSVGAILIAWFIGQQQLERERQRTQDERRRIRLERRHAIAQARRAEAARVFYLANEFDFLNMRIEAARKDGEDLNTERWLYALQDLLSRLDYERSDGSKMTLVFELRQELLKLIDIFMVKRKDSWLLEFCNVFGNVCDRVRGIEVQANIDLRSADCELEQFAVTGLPGDVLSAREAGLIP